MFSTRIRAFLVSLLIAELVLTYFGVRYRNRLQADEELLSDFNASTVSRGFTLEEPSFPAPFAPVTDLIGIEVVAKGDAFSQTFKDQKTGEVLGEGTIIKAVARDDFGFARELKFVVQFRLSDEQRNLADWITGSSSMLTVSQVAELFPRGSQWNFVILSEPERDELKDVIEYKNYVERYYGDTLTKLQSFLQNGLEGNYSKALFLLDVVPPVGGNR